MNGRLTGRDASVHVVQGSTGAQRETLPLCTLSVYIAIQPVAVAAATSHYQSSAAATDQPTDADTAAAAVAAVVR